MKLLLNNLSDIETVAKKFVENIGDRNVFAFYGQMGVGKTTFIKAICKALGVTETITSPTFAIVNEYVDKIQQSVFHMDLYRLKSSDELLDIGAEEYFYSGNVCLIEWSEKAENMLPDERINVWMEEIGENKRRIRLENV